MADILIRGMKMPKNEPMLVKINPDGSVSTTAKNNYRKYEAIPVPPHGRLIDADELRSEYKEPMDWLDRTQVTYHVTGIWASIDAAPTVITASGGEQ